MIGEDLLLERVTAAAEERKLSRNSLLAYRRTWLKIIAWAAAEGLVLETLPSERVGEVAAKAQSLGDGREFQGRRAARKAAGSFPTRGARRTARCGVSAFISSASAEKVRLSKCIWDQLLQNAANRSH